MNIRLSLNIVRLVDEASRLQESQDARQELQRELGTLAARLESLQGSLDSKVESIQSLEAALEALKTELADGLCELQRRGDRYVSTRRTLGYLCNAFTGFMSLRQSIRYAECI